MEGIRIIDHLVKETQDRKEAVKEKMEAGQYPEYSAYREAVGECRAMNRTLEQLNELRKKTIYGDEDDD